MKQKYKGVFLRQKVCINRILSFYRLASPSEHMEGMNWYNSANNYCRDLAYRFNISLPVAAGLIAVFSPQTGWLENKKYVYNYLATGEKKRPGDQLKKAHTILQLNRETDIYHALSFNGGAFKCKSFYLNILKPEDVTNVTVDRHAISICIQTPKTVESLGEDFAKNMTKLQYQFFENCYREAAAQLGIMPHQLQAITWTVYRRLRELRRYDELPLAS